MSTMLRLLCCALLLSGAALAQTAPAPHAPMVHSDAVLGTETVPTPKRTAAKGVISLQSPQAQTQYSHGDPTDQEQLLLELINRARMNPAAEGDSLFNTTDTWVVNNYNFWHVDKAAVRAAFKTYPARPPLAFHPKAIDAARVHSADMRDHQFQDHTGSDGSNPGQRLTKAGYVTSNYGENIFAYAHSMWEAECGFLVDWGTGNEGLGHRHNTMNFGPTDQIYTEIGIGVYAGSGSVGPWVVTEDFATRGERYITGVVFKDKNNNKQYDPGEGLKGVKITPSQGSYYAVTSTSGGYAIPMGTTTGTVFVTAEGNGISDAKAVTLSGGANVKVDFGQASTPIVILMTPEDQAQVTTDTTRLVWKKNATASTYHLQVSLTDDFKKFVVNDSTIAAKDTSFVLRKLMQDSSYFWRVRAKSTTLGWGEFVPPFTFNAAILPNSVKLLSPTSSTRIKDKNFSFSWTKSEPGVVKYWFEIGDDSLFTNVIMDNYEVADTTWKLSDPDGKLENDIPYYWRVAGFHNDFVQGPFSAPNWFILGEIVNGVDDDKALVVHALSPNPVKGLMLLRYTVPQACTVEISLCDETGATVARFPSEQVTAGENTLNLDFSSEKLAGLSSGSYFLRFANGSSVSTRKLILQR